MLEELIFAGFGGQGILSAGMILARAAMRQGYEVAWIPSYGPEMRGGTANANVMISDLQIGSPSTAHPTGVVVMNQPSFEKFEPMVAAGGLLVVNSSLVESRSRRPDITLLYVPAGEIASEAGSRLVVSVAALGALNGAKDLVSADRIEEALAWALPEHRHHLVEINMAAFRRGMEVGRSAGRRDRQGA